MGDVKLNSSGGGSVTLTTPSTASNLTVTLPSASGTLATTSGSLASPTITGTVAGGATYTSPTLTGASITAANSNTVEATSGPTSSQLAGNRNKIINGAMQVWQRGTSFSSGYTADRWYIAGGASNSVTQASDAPTQFKYSLNYSGSNYGGVAQRIEALNCSDLSGQTVTLSFWAKSISGAAVLAVSLYYASASDNWTTSTQISTSYPSITSTWAQYTITFASLPSGVTNGLQLTIYNSTSGSTNFEITGVQLEKGATATPFENRLYGTELALCQRYLPAWTFGGSYTTVCQAQAYSTSAAAGVLTFPVTPRVNPTGITATGTFTSITANYGVGGAGTLAISSYTSSGHVGLLLTGSSGLIAGNATQIACVAGGTLYATGCEL